MTAAKGVLTARLLAVGWTRDNGPHAGECGCQPGYCMRSARWTRPGSGKPMCAQHAEQFDSGRLI